MFNSLVDTVEAMSTATGRRAETAAAEYLRQLGFQILAMNWRRPRCEVDIICQKKQRWPARKASMVYIVEVKYRAQSGQGDGLAYITDQKLSQLTYAAQLFMSEYGYSGPIGLLGIAVTGDDYTIEHVIELEAKQSS